MHILCLWQWILQRMPMEKCVVIMSLKTFKLFCLILQSLVWCGKMFDDDEDAKVCVEQPVRVIHIHSWWCGHPTDCCLCTCSFVIMLCWCICFGHSTALAKKQFLNKMLAWMCVFGLQQSQQELLFHCHCVSCCFLGICKGRNQQHILRHSGGQSKENIDNGSC